MWHLLVLTGAHIGEVLALTRADLLPDGLLVDESALDGHSLTTKNKKSRTVPIPASLRSELEEWLAEHYHSLRSRHRRGRCTTEETSTCVRWLSVPVPQRRFPT